MNSVRPVSAQTYSALTEVIWQLERKNLSALAQSLRDLSGGGGSFNSLLKYEIVSMALRLEQHDFVRAASHLERCVGAAWGDLDAETKGRLLRAAKALREGDLRRVALLLADLRQKLRETTPSLEDRSGRVRR